MAYRRPPHNSFQPHDSLFADGELERRVCTFLVTHGGAWGKQVRVGAAAGQVVLRERVATPNDKRMIESCSRRVAGVLGARNEIRVVTLKHSNLTRQAGRRKYLTAGFSDTPRCARVPSISSLIGIHVTYCHEDHYDNRR